MATLNIIYKIAADISGLEQNVSKGVQTMSRMESAARTIATAIPVAFAVDAVMRFGKEIVADADALTKLHDKTGISTTGLQAMRIAGDDAGVSLESMTSAVNMLQKKLGGNDESAVKALKDLNINIDAFRRMDGAQQMSTLADAVKDMHDPLRVANDLSGIFGKQWAEQLPVLKRGFQELKDGTSQMSEQAVKDLDDLGDAFTKMYRSARASLGEGMADLFNRLRADYRSLKVLNGEGATESDAFAAAADRMAVQLAKADYSFSGVTMSAEDLNFAEKDLTKTTKEHIAVVEKSAEAHKRLQKEFQNSVVYGQKFKLTVADISEASTLADSSVFHLESTVGDLSHKFAQDLQPQLIEAGGNMRQATEDTKTMADTITGHLQQALGRIPQMFIDAFTGGGGLIGALKGIGVDLLNSIVGSILKPIMDSVAGWAGGIASKIAGAFGGGGGLGGGITSGLIGGGGGGGGVAAGGAGLGIGLGGALATGGIIGAVALGGFIASTWNQPTINTTMGGDGMTIGEAIKEHNAMSPAEQMQEYANKNRDLYNRQVLEGSMPPGFASGSHGIRDFGAGTLAMLHGREAVLTEGQLSGVGGGVTIHVHGSVVTERQLVDLVNDANTRTDRVRSRWRAA